jgi:hypothetical protein
MLPDVLAPLEDKPHSRYEQARPGQETADDGQNAGSQARHC